MLLTELRALLNRARTPSRREAIRQLIRRAESRQATEPSRQTRRLLDSVLSAVTQGQGQASIDDLITGYSNAIELWAQAEAVAERRQARTDALRRLFAAATATQLRGLFGLPFDREGKVKPPPQPVGRLEIDNPTEAQLLEFMSPMLVVDGDGLEERDFHPVTRALSVMEEQSPVAAVASSPLIAAAVQRSTTKLRGVILAAVANVTDDLQTWFRERLLKPLGLFRSRPEVVTFPQEVGGAVGEIRAEQRGAGNEDVLDALIGDSYVGYTLHSAFAINTRPQHARRDGRKFYVDNREGSYKPWAERIVVPYWYDSEETETGLRQGGRCLCFTIPILETPEGEEYFAEFQVRNSGGTLITARDVGTLRSWFGGQRTGVRRQLVGQRRWEAVGSDTATLEDFYGINGRMVSARRLAAEDALERRARVDRVRAIMDSQERRHRDAWERWNYNDRFDGQVDREMRYLNRLRRLFANLQAS